MRTRNLSRWCTPALFSLAVACAAHVDEAEEGDALKRSLEVTKSRCAPLLHCLASGGGSGCSGGPRAGEDAKHFGRKLTMCHQDPTCFEAVCGVRYFVGPSALACWRRQGTFDCFNVDRLMLGTWHGEGKKVGSEDSAPKRVIQVQRGHLVVVKFNGSPPTVVVRNESNEPADHRVGDYGVDHLGPYITYTEREGSNRFEYKLRLHHPFRDVLWI